MGNFFKSVAEIKKANEALGRCFFSPETMRFFRSYVVSDEVIGGRYFVTSESAGDGHPRLYTIREASPDGECDTVGDFQGFETYEEARREALRLASLIDKGGAKKGRRKA